MVLLTSITTKRPGEGRPEAVLSCPVDESRGSSPAYHLPVLAAEVVHGLQVAEGGVYLDGTLGEGGHSQAILEAGTETGAAGESVADGSSSETAQVFGIDLDSRSVEAARRRLAGFGARFTARQGNYADMDSAAAEQGIERVDGVLLDLGFSSRQVDRPGYGLSFLNDEPLDMRYDSGQERDAADIVNGSSESELAGIFRTLGEEPRSRLIARTIVRERAKGRIGTTAELASLVERAAGRRPGHRLHPATRVFQALRIAVNGELDNLQRGLEAAVALLRPERTAGGNQLSQPGRPDSQELHGASVGGVRLPSGAAAMRLREGAGDGHSKPPRYPPFGGGSSVQPPQPQRAAAAGPANPGPNPIPP